MLWEGLGNIACVCARMRAVGVGNPLSSAKFVKVGFKICEQIQEQSRKIQWTGGHSSGSIHRSRQRNSQCFPPLSRPTELPFRTIHFQVRLVAIRLPALSQEPFAYYVANDARNSRPHAYTISLPWHKSARCMLRVPSL